MRTSIIASLMGGFLCASQVPSAFAQEGSSVEAPKNATMGTSGDEGAATTASNDDPKQLARECFGRGSLAFEAGRFAEAAAEFEKAQFYAPHSVALYNAAKSWLAAGERQRAADSYSEAIQRGELDPELNVDAQRQLRELRKELGWVVVDGIAGAKVTVGYKLSTAVPFVTHLPAGTHTVEAVLADGTVLRRVVKISPNQPQSFLVEQASPQNQTPQSKNPEPSVSESTSGTSSLKTWGYVGIGLGAAAGATAGILGGLTLDSNSKYEASGFTSASLHDQTESMKLWTNVAAISGAALGAVGLVLVLSAPSEPETPQVSFVFGPSSVSARVGF